MVLSLVEYSQAKRLPVEFLEGLGLYDSPTGVAIPVYNRDGSFYAIRTRERMEGQPKVKQQYGKPLIPYGLERLESGPALIVVEGESDAHACWLHGFAALGLPGSSWKREWRTDFTLYENIYLYDEGDCANRKLANKIAADWQGLRSLKVGNYRDPAALHAAEPDEFESLMRAAMSRASAIRTPRPKPVRRQPRRPYRDWIGLDIVTVVEKYTKLRRAGSELFGLCPLHVEQTASFHVSPAKNAWFCHGACARGGGVRDFLEAIGEAA